MGVLTMFDPNLIRWLLKLLYFAEPHTLPKRKA